jgi:hypothetical protein
LGEPRRSQNLIGNQESPRELRGCRDSRSRKIQQHPIRNVYQETPTATRTCPQIAGEHAKRMASKINEFNPCLNRIPPPPPSQPHRIPHQKILWHRTDCFGVIGFRTDIICLLHILFGNLVKHVSWGAEFQNHLEKAKVQGQNHTCSIGFHKCPLVFVGFHILSWFSIGFQTLAGTLMC